MLVYVCHHWVGCVPVIGKIVKYRGGEEKEGYGEKESERDEGLCWSILHYV